ncbi:MAG: right-handed parallel beta-helix repeat-containing protein [Coriobacteriia bacterium]|nr:right-handed parallel beta-helix repeat-containing protein [Coriobacteriia bacterium]
MPAVAPVARETNARRRPRLVPLALVLVLALSPASHAFAGSFATSAQSAPAPAPAAVEAARPAPALCSALKGLSPFAVQAAYAAPPEGEAHSSPSSEAGTQESVQTTLLRPASKPSLISRIKALWSSVFSASEASAAPAEGTPDGPQAPAPYATTEITENRTLFSREYRMGNGNIRAQYSSVPLNFTDPETGRLEPVGTALERTEGEGEAPASWTNAANAFTITLPASLSEAPVTIEASGTSVFMRPASSARPGGAHASEGIVSARPDGDATLSYPQAFIGSTLEYRSTPRGLKETIVLDRAPSNGEHIWSFGLGLDGLAPALQEDGSVTFTKTGTDDTVFVIPAPYMEDSAKPKTRGSLSRAVRYGLSGVTSSGCILSVVADSAWLQDPGRVYPCRIDPSLYFVGYQADPWEVLSTTVSSAPGWEDSNFSWCDYVWASDGYLSSGITEHAYLRPPASFFTGYWVPPGYSLSEARLWLYGGYVDGPGFVTAEACEGYTPPLDWLTWNGYMNGEGQVTSDHASPEADLMQGPDWNNDYGYHHALDITDMVMEWQMSGDEAVRISAGPGTYAEFNAGSSACAPVWEAVYADAPMPARPEAQITSPSGSQPASPTLEWGYYQEDNIPQAAWEARVQTGAESASTVARASGEDSGNSGIPVPEPHGGFVPGTTYHARVRVAYDAGEGTNYYPYLRWGGWDEATFTVPLPVTAPTAQLTSPSGAVGSMPPPKAAWTYAQPDLIAQSAWEVAVAAAPAGPAIASRPGSGSDTGTVVPQPPGGLVAGTTYYAKVRAACDTAPGVPLWGEWSAETTFSVLPPPTTPVGGTISQDTTWTVSGSPYVLNSTVTVPANRRLAIEPGVVVKGSAGAIGLVVLGTLDAQGTTETPIVFTSINDNTVGGATGNGSPVAGNWMGIRFQGSDSNASSLKHAEVRYAGASGRVDGGGVTGSYSTALLIGGAAQPALIESVVVTASAGNGVHILSGSPVLSSITQSGGSTGAAVDTSASPAITNSSFSNNTAYALSIGASATPTVTGCSLSSNAGTGLSIGAGAMPAVTSTAIDSNGSYAVVMHPNSTPALTGVTGTGNGRDLIRLTGTRTVATPLTLLAADAAFPYFGDFTIGEGAHVTAAAGAVFKGESYNDDQTFSQDYVHDALTVRGTFTSQGTPQKPVILTSINDHSPSAGGDTGSGTYPALRWGGVRFARGSASQSTLTNVEIRHGGGKVRSYIDGNPRSHYASLLIGWGAEPTVAGVKIEHSSNNGIEILHGSPTLTNITYSGSGTGLRIEGTASPMIEDSLFSSDSGYLAEINANSSPGFSNVKFDAGANSIRGFHIIGNRTVINRSLHLPDLGIPYVAGLTIGPGATVKIDPGVVYKHQTSGSESITVYGTLDAQGTPEKPIVFTSIHDDDFGGDTYNNGRVAPSAGDWVGVRFCGSAASSSILKNAHIRYAGRTASIGSPAFNASAGLLFVDGASPTVDGITVMRASGTGVLVHSSSPAVSHITQSGFNGPGAKTTYGIRLQEDASPVISGSRFEGNTYGLHAALGTSGMVGNSGFCENNYGVYALAGSSVTATGSIISTNTVSGIHIVGGTHSFQGCAINGNGASGFRVASSDATVTVTSSNLFENGTFWPWNVNLDVNASVPPTPTVNASGNYWGEYGPRFEETATANITNPQPIPNLVENLLYGEAVLWPNPFMNNINEVFIDNGHVNYKAEPASYNLEPDKTKYAHLVYPAASIWNGYKPGVIRETNGSDALFVKIYDYSDSSDTARAVTTASKPGTIKLNVYHLDSPSSSEGANTRTVAHELGHCLGLYHGNSTDDLMYGTSPGHYQPLTKNDKASYDAAYKLY